MTLDLLGWLERRLHPKEGWLPLILLLTIVLLLALAVANVDWVPEAPVVFVTSLGGLMMAVVLARRPLGRLLAWILITAYGIVITVAWLGGLAPPLDLLLRGWMPVSSHIRQSWAVFIDRTGGWLSSALGQGQSEETIVFALGLGLLAWFLAAYAGWAIVRQRRPWASLALLALALAVNNYYGEGELWSLPLFVGLLVALVAVIGQVSRETDWTRRGVDYSSEIRFDLLVYSGATALALLFVSAALPTVNFQAISRAIVNRPAVDQAERTLERIFAGVRQPGQQTGVGEEALATGAGSGGGTLPRAFLLGAGPELLESVVMTATVQGEALRATHWRGLSYDLYTGLGWAVTDERQEPLAAGQEIQLPPVAATAVLTQTVVEVDDAASLRYTLGLPERFDQPATASWHGRDDLSRVEGQGARYTAVSRVSMATVVALRGASLADVPPPLMARYTALPDTVPERVLDLGRQVAGQAATPYDQAKALEAFLRQYPYSLGIKLPPAGRDPVDYFLFEQQTGYCDYYASAMVVLARSLGLPARLAAGYLAPSTVDGQQTIRQVDAHAWAEVYFAGYGWLEFEPTPAFPAEVAPPPLPGEAGFDSAADTSAPPIPAQQVDRNGYLWLLALIPLLLASLWLWRVRGRGGITPSDQAAWAYQRLQLRADRLGQAARPSQTPAEFADAFLDHLALLGRGRVADRLHLAQLEPEIRRLAHLFAGRQYARQKPPAEEAVASWRQIRRRLWVLTLLENLRSLWPFG